VLSFMFPQATVVRRDVLEKLHGFYEQDRCSYGEDSFSGCECCSPRLSTRASRPS
jgi:hypothetical protein